GVDPLDLIEHFGTDAMRITLAQLASETQDIRMPVEYLCPHCGETFPQKPKHLKKPVVQCDKCQQEFATRLASQADIDANKLGLTLSSRFDFGRNMCNKLWQMANGFVFPNIEKMDANTGHAGAGALRLEDRWILSRLAACTQEIDRRLERYQFSDIVQALYGFFWNDLCDWYVELIKPRLYVEEGAADDGGDMARHVLTWVLDQTLRLMQPIAPFITEALWERLGEIAPQRRSPIGGQAMKPGSLTEAAWPTVADGQRAAVAEREMDELQDVIRALRDVLAQINNNRSQAGESAIRALPSAAIRCGSEVAGRLSRAERILKRLGSCDAFEIGPQVGKPADAMTRVLTGIEVYVPVTGLVNLEVERKRLGKERDELEKYIRQVEGKLSNEKFVANAPANVVEQERARLAELQEKLAAIARNLADLG
ncbi:MAG: class I tRNA ligase family protein, partial [Phycisphaerales bacterium]|nr:class I tRNA ligase family protein [Phycisphaerales bacterium]